MNLSSGQNSEHLRFADDRMISSGIASFISAKGAGRAVE